MAYPPPEPDNRALARRVSALEQVLQRLVNQMLVDTNMHLKAADDAGRSRELHQQALTDIANQLAAADAPTPTFSPPKGDGIAGGSGVIATIRAQSQGDRGVPRPVAFQDITAGGPGRGDDFEPVRQPAVDAPRWTLPRTPEPALNFEALLQFLTPHWLHPPPDSFGDQGRERMLQVARFIAQQWPGARPSLSEDLLCNLYRQLSFELKGHLVVLVAPSSTQQDHRMLKSELLFETAAGTPMEPGVKYTMNRLGLLTQVVQDHELHAGVVRQKCQVIHRQ